MPGQATLQITLDNNDVQISNFGDNSFQITNTGDKTITQVDLDVSNALYPDSVFDPFGQAGDTTSKPLTIDNNGGTGVVAPNNTSYVGAGGRAGYKGLQLKFDDSVNGGFEPGETIGFSIDMDSNSVAGTNKDLLDGGTNPGWDVGGVSGAELIGSSFKVTFTDGTTATGQLQGNGNQGGSQALADQDSPEVKISLTVNGLGAGSIGTYGDQQPPVIVNGPIGQTVRVVLSKGFIQPVTPYASFLENQLNALAETNFPANNAVEFQTVDVLLTEENQDISANFDFTNVASYDFEGEERLPLGFVASVIDVNNENLSLGAVTEPIYLQFSDTDNSVEQQNDINTTDAIRSVIVEAEDITDLVGYRLENNSLASDDSLLSLVGGAQNEIGSASFNFSGETGNYNIILGTYDENDGQGTIRVSQENKVLNNLVLDKNLGSDRISINNQVKATVATNVLITKGDNFTITGFENDSEHSRFDYIEFEAVDGTSDLTNVVSRVEPLAGGININFGLAGSENVAGFILDTGKAYNARRGYGWVTQNILGSNSRIPIDVSVNGRDRDTLFDDGQGGLFQEPVKDSLIHMQYPTGFINSRPKLTTPAAWEYALANGQYEVTVGVGDPQYLDSTHVINVEGETLISGFTATGSESQAFSTASATIEVNDGKLTLDAIGGFNTKINYISFVPLDTL
ncbi:MAG: hypothetical protein AAF298_10555 [Cyanobacteria bacterium P01_A01_bin.40]